MTLKELKVSISEFIESEVSIAFNKRDAHGIIDLVLDKKITIGYDFMASLLTVVLHKPSSINKAEDWVKTQFKREREKEWSEDRLKKKILQEAEKHIKVLAKWGTIFQIFWFKYKKINKFKEFQIWTIVCCIPKKQIFKKVW